MVEGLEAEAEAEDLFDEEDVLEDGDLEGFGVEDGEDD